MCGWLGVGRRDPIPTPHQDGSEPAPPLTGPTAITAPRNLTASGRDDARSSACRRLCSARLIFISGLYTASVYNPVQPSVTHRRCHRGAQSRARRFADSPSVQLPQDALQGACTYHSVIMNVTAYAVRRALRGTRQSVQGLQCKRNVYEWV